MTPRARAALGAFQPIVDQVLALGDELTPEVLADLTGLADDLALAVGVTEPEPPVIVPEGEVAPEPPAREPAFRVTRTAEGEPVVRAKRPEGELAAETIQELLQWTMTRRLQPIARQLLQALVGVQELEEVFAQVLDEVQQWRAAGQRLGFSL